MVASMHASSLLAMPVSGSQAKERCIQGHHTLLKRKNSAKAVDQTVQKKVSFRA
jgi:hypothetical protein